jgi:hypothetical protein
MIIIETPFGVDKDRERKKVGVQPQGPARISFNTA